MLSPLEQRIRAAYGVPAAHISVTERISVAEVMRIKASLRERGLVPRMPLVEPEPEQLAFDVCAPPANGELGWTTTTDPRGW